MTQTLTASGERIRTLLAELASELNPGRPAPPIHLHTRLDRDLGLDSLARVELLARLEQEFGRRLEDRVAIEAERVEDLVRALHESGAVEVRPRDLRQLVPQGAGGAYPREATTLIEVLEHHAQRTPDRVQVYLYDEDDQVQELTFAALLDLADHVAGGLQSQGLAQGQAVAIMLPTGREFFAAFFGILLAGGVPVPLYPPVRPSQIEEHLRRQAGILRTAECPLLITVDEAKRLGYFLRSQVPGLRGLVTVEELSGHGPRQASPRVVGSDTGFLQFTSGSTSDPKGVVLTHQNLLANIRAIGDFVSPRPDDVFVSWLPLYHDMGLIGAVLTTLYHAVPLVLMSPLAFLLRPERWLWAMHRHRGTLSAAPNFAYELCVKKVDRETSAGLDLSAWRMTLNGAEPISPQAMTRFAERFAEHGYRPETMTPTYGLAECSLALAMTPLERLPRIDRIARSFAQDGRATPAPDGEALEFVSCGAALPGHELRIVDSAGRELPERQEGRLQFRGPSATAGYFRNLEATRGLVLPDGWLDSGDLAYVAEGEVYLTGRIKDVIIRAGRNIYPHELEEAVGGLPGVRAGCVAVFGARAKGSSTEELVVLAETREQDPDAKRALEARIRELAQDLLGTPPDTVLLVPPQTVLKTSSGKLRRAACRQLYEEGRLQAGGRAPWLQVARMGAEGALFAAGDRLRGLREASWSARFWGTFAPTYAAGWALAATLPSLDLRWRAVGASARAFLFLSGVKLSVEGREHLAREGAQVLVANHASYLDGVLVPVILPRATAVVVKRELRESFPARVLLDNLRAVFVERFDVRGGLKDAGGVSEALAEGRPVLVFPEGTCLRMPGLLPFRLGAFGAAAQSEVPVVPITIRGTRNVLRPGTWFARRGEIEVEIGEPIVPSGTGFADALELRNAARAAILAACREPDLAGEDAQEHLRPTSEAGA